MRIGLAFGDVRGQRDLAEITRQIRATRGTAWISQGPNLDALTTLAVWVAGELADGTITWMTGPRTLAGHVVPSITKAANGRTPRIVAGLAICVTEAEDAVRARFATEYALAGQVPEYRAMLDREGVNGPADVLLAGDEDAIAKQLDQLRDTGITDLMLAPIGTPAEQARTVEFLRLVR
ncbi:LLM class flavin-dependent oxidoreductase [Kribbella sp. NPDC050241]|uniref:LLM class flavin-dependent oxidoreductase n=1 Tax=Kribbella sp. NPDC050241 TaxID=3364115 RepID=UPI0037B287D5